MNLYFHNMTCYKSMQDAKENYCYKSMQDAEENYCSL
jgi:hypothetical protein